MYYFLLSFSSNSYRNLNVYIFTNPFARAGYDIRSIFLKKCGRVSPGQCAYISINRNIFLSGNVYIDHIMFAETRLM